MQRCVISGKKPIVGRSIARRGLAKKSGGVGKKITGITRRRFMPNLQRVKVRFPDGTIKRVLVAASEIQAGNITKAVGSRKEYLQSEGARNRAKEGLKTFKKD